MTTGTNYHVVREVLKSTPQDLTDAWADVGSEIDMRGYNSLGIWLNLDVNSSSNMRIRALAKLDSAGTTEYNMPIKTVGASAVLLENEYFEWNVDADNNFFFDIETSGHVAYIQLQAQVSAVGATAAQIDYAEITKTWV
jgi:hypothetical protein